MEDDTPSCRGHRFPAEIIGHTVWAAWLYHCFCLSLRDVEVLLDQRGITVSYETIRLWCFKFGPEYARGLKRRQGRLGGRSNVRGVTRKGDVTSAGTGLLAQRQL